MNSNALLRAAADVLELAPRETIWADLVSGFSRTLGIDWVFVAKFLAGSEMKLRTLAASRRGRPVENFEYELTAPFDGSPAQATRIYPTEAGKYLQNAWIERVKAESFGEIRLVGRLGQAWGVLAVAHSRTLESPAQVDAMLRIYAFKATVELEREDADERFYSQLLDGLKVQGSDSSLYAKLISSNND